MSEATGTAERPSRRPRSPIRRTTVAAVEILSPLVRRVVLKGEALEGFGPPRPAAHIKLHMLPEGTPWPDDEALPRPPRRTYTPRLYDARANALAVDFVLHGHGLAATWAAAATPGQTMYVSGPGGGYEIPQGAKHLVIAADDTALPAAGMILESLPPDCTATLLAEVATQEEQRDLTMPGRASATCDVRWLPRAPTRASAGSLLEAALADRSLPDGAVFWIACEAAAMRRIRNHLAVTRGISMTRIHTRGYWKQGETAYPDHDYGND